MDLRRAMTGASPAGLKPLAMAGLVKSASAACAVPRPGAEGTPVASTN